MEGSTLLMSTRTSSPAGSAASKRIEKRHNVASAKKICGNDRVFASNMRPIIPAKCECERPLLSAPGHTGWRVCPGDTLQEKSGAIFRNVKAKLEIRALSIYGRRLRVEKQIGIL